MRVLLLNDEGWELLAGTAVEGGISVGLGEGSAILGASEGDKFLLIG